MEWFKVEEKLPPLNKAVITFGYNVSSGEKDVDGCCSFNGKEWETDANGTISDAYYKITHWMPMPEPPEY